MCKIMKKICFCIVMMQLCAVSVWAQSITLHSAVRNTPTNFIQENLVGEGVAIFNAEFQGSHGLINHNQIGTFEANGYTGFMMNSGVIMTTGNLEVAMGPNISGRMTSWVYPFFSDSLLMAVYACSVLDFDFVGRADTISFNYCFASEEYPEYVGSNFNDIFVFYVTGPDPETGEQVTRNIAIVPGSQTAEHPEGIPVAINSVNGVDLPNCYNPEYHSEYSQYYRDVEPGNPYLQFDGHTTKLLAGMRIIPCALYHMHISVCNVSDNELDSGVFLEQNSMKSQSSVLTYNSTGHELISLECARPIRLAMNRFGLEEIHARVSFGGTAVEGVDFECTTADGAPVHSADLFTISQEKPYFLINPLSGTALLDKTLDITLNVGVCPEFPTLVTNERLHCEFGSTPSLSVLDTMFEAEQVVSRMGVRLESGVADFEWFPKDGLVNPYSQVTGCNIRQSCDYICVAYDRYGCSVDTAHVHVQINNPVAIDKSEELPQVKIYPNPASQKVAVSAEGLCGIDVYSIAGKRVKTLAVQEENCVMDISSLPAGVYVIYVYVKNGFSAHKLIVK